MTKATQQAADYRFEKTNETPRTVRVRIAVAVAKDGSYMAAGWSTKEGNNDIVVMDCARGELDNADGDRDPVVSCWIEADVPLPATQTIRGEIVS